MLCLLHTVWEGKIKSSLCNQFFLRQQTERGCLRWVCLQFLCLWTTGEAGQNRQRGWPDLLAHKHTGGKSKTIPWHQYIALYKNSKIKYTGTRPPDTKPRQKCYDPTLCSNQVCVQTPETQETSWGSSYSSSLQQLSRRLFFCHVKAMLMLKGNVPHPSSCLVQLQLYKEGKAQSLCGKGFPCRRGSPTRGRCDAACPVGQHPHLASVSGGWRDERIGEMQKVKECLTPPFFRFMGLVYSQS